MLKDSKWNKTQVECVGECYIHKIKKSVKDKEIVNELYF